MNARLRWLLLAGGSWLLASLAFAEVPADAVWVDVRTPAEYQRGHIEDAHLIPWDGIEKGIAELQLTPDTPIYLYCASGGRSARAQQRLQQMGYSRAVNAGGLEDARRLLAEDR